MILTDNMKTVVLDRGDGQIRWSPSFLDFASYYGFVPRASHPYRPQTSSYIERFHRSLKEEVGLAEYRNLEETRASIEDCATALLGRRM